MKQLQLLMTIELMMLTQLNLMPHERKATLL